MQSNSPDARNAPDEPLELKKPSSFEDIASTIGSRNLMIIIVTMPLVFLAVVTAIITVFGADDEIETAAASPASASVAIERLAEPAPAARATGATAISAAPAAIGLAPGADIAAMSLDGDRLALRVDGPDGVSIVIYDIAAGEVVQRIAVTQAREN